jgi:hypothetical protein
MEGMPAAGPRKGSCQYRFQQKLPGNVTTVLADDGTTGTAGNRKGSDLMPAIPDLTLNNGVEIPEA